MQISEKMPSKLEIIPEFISNLLKRLKFSAIDKDNIFDIRLSLEEALINAVEHGNKLNPHLFVEVKVRLQDNGLSIDVKDNGDGFDYKNIVDPTIDKNLTKLFGRGIFLIKNLMDRVEFFDDGRIIRMYRRFKKEDSGEYKTRTT